MSELEILKIESLEYARRNFEESHSINRLSKNELETILRDVPNEYFMNKIKTNKLEEFVGFFCSMKNRIEKAMLVKKALNVRLGEIYDISQKGLSTHGEGFGLVKSINSLLSMIENELGDRGFGGSNNQFHKHLDSYIHQFRYGFKEIEQVLSMKSDIITKREKKILLRAFLEDGTRQIDDLRNFDVVTIYYVFYDIYLDQYLSIIKKITDQRKTKFEGNLVTCNDCIHFRKPNYSERFRNESNTFDISPCSYYGHLVMGELEEGIWKCDCKNKKVKEFVEDIEIEEIEED